jgi:hypothetical protein
MEQSSFLKKNAGLFFIFFWRIKKLGHPICYNCKGGFPGITERRQMNDSGRLAGKIASTKSA